MAFASARVIKVRPLKTVTFTYDTREDRILAGINLGQSEAWSCWLTRRLVLALLERAPKFIASTSVLAQRSPIDIRGEIVAFERDAAITKTAKAMTHTPTDVLKTSAATAELANQLTISSQRQNFRVELQGESGDGAAAMIERSELQRILYMLQAEVARAAWVVLPGKLPEISENNAPKPARH
jgi:hypothetical protein